MNGMQSHLHTPTYASIYLDMLFQCHCATIVLLSCYHMQNFTWQVNHMPTLLQVCSVILFQIIHLKLHFKLSFHLWKSTVLYSIWKLTYQCEQRTKTIEPSKCKSMNGADETFHIIFILILYISLFLTLLFPHQYSISC